MTPGTSSSSAASSASSSSSSKNAHRAVPCSEWKSNMTTPGTVVVYYCCGENCPSFRSGATAWGGNKQENYFFTFDSPVCKCARAQGLIGDQGGMFQVTGQPGLQAYHGIEQNGVKTNDWLKQWRGSMTLAPAPENTLLPTPQEMEALHSKVSRFSPYSGYYDEEYDDFEYGISATGGYSFNKKDSNAGDEDDCTKYSHDSCKGTFTCIGPKCRRRNGTLWGVEKGTGAEIFTGDSSICKAAVFAGVIDAKAENVSFTLLPVGACNTGFQGSTSHNVVANSWGSYSNCFKVTQAPGDYILKREQKKKEKERQEKEKQEAKKREEQRLLMEKQQRLKQRGVAPGVEFFTHEELVKLSDRPPTSSSSSSSSQITTFYQTSSSTTTSMTAFREPDQRSCGHPQPEWKKRKKLWESRQEIEERMRMLSKAKPTHFNISPTTTIIPSSTQQTLSSYQQKYTNLPKGVNFCLSYVKDSCTGTYFCPGGTCPGRSRTVYGSAACITGDSSCCAAAQLSGAIPQNSHGTFQLTQVPVAPSYPSATQNGIKTQAWSTSWGAAYVVKAAPASMVYTPAPLAPPPPFAPSPSPPNPNLPSAS